ncbi:MAG TPA: ABC transporter substrate-binding protein [Nevskiaceae bacterium]
MKSRNGTSGVLGAPLTRRKVLAGAAAGGLALALGGTRVFAAAVDEEIRIGFLSPRSGNLGLYGESDPYVLGLARQALERGLTIGGRSYRVRIIDRDTQSSPSRASQLASEMITKDHVHLILAASTPEVTNPVADACEAAGVPNLATEVPWESFYFARGAKPGEPSPFKWTYVYSFGTSQFVEAYLSTFASLKTNRKIGVLYPNDADGNAVRANLAPQLAKHGYTIVDPGPYQDGTSDYSSQIAMFKREKCQIFNAVALPPDFAAFWRQAAQLHYTDEVVIAEVAKAIQFQTQIQSLGSIGRNLSCTTSWSPAFPYKSSLTGTTGRALAAGYEKASGKYWNQGLGVTLALIDAGIVALRHAADPTDHGAIRDAIAHLDTTTMIGPCNFRDGPYPNVAIAPQIGTQWITAPAGSKFPLAQVTIEHAADPQVPIEHKLVPYNA